MRREPRQTKQVKDTHTHTHTHTHTRAHACTHARTHARTCTYAHTLTHTYAHMTFSAHPFRALRIVCYWLRRLQQISRSTNPQMRCFSPDFRYKNRVAHWPNLLKSQCCWDRTQTAEQTGSSHQSEGQKRCGIIETAFTHPQCYRRNNGVDAVCI